MLKRWFLLTSLLTISAILTSGFVKPKTENSFEWFETNNSAYIVHYAPTEKQLEYIHFDFPYAGKTITGFRQAIAYRESNGKLNTINTLGCVGKYQFERNTLKSVGVKNVSQFLKNPTLQEKAFIALLSKNKWELRKEIEKYEGKVIGGVLITESGILAAAHLGGVGATKKFLRTKGRSAYTDGYGTSMKVYIKKFGGYDTSAIPAILNATIH
jgi:hypothetical protein